MAYVGDLKDVLGGDIIPAPPLGNFAPLLTPIDRLYGENALLILDRYDEVVVLGLSPEHAQDAEILMGPHAAAAPYTLRLLDPARAAEQPTPTPVPDQMAVLEIPYTQLSPETLGAAQPNMEMTVYAVLLVDDANEAADTTAAPRTLIVRAAQHVTVLHNGRDADGHSAPVVTIVALPGDASMLRHYIDAGAPMLLVRSYP